MWSDDKRGSLRPPFFAVRYRGAVLAERASPAQRFRYLEASVCKVFSAHEMGNSSIESSQVRRGHTPARYTRSFCLRVRGQASILVSISSSLDDIVARNLDWSDGTSIVIPRNLTPFGAYGTCSPPRKRDGSIFFPLEACSPKHAHFDILACIPDQRSQVAVISIRCWHDAGELPIRQVSSAY